MNYINIQDKHLFKNTMNVFIHDEQKRIGRKERKYTLVTEKRKQKHKTKSERKKLNRPKKTMFKIPNKS